MFAYIFIALYFIAAVLNITASKKENKKLFRITKPMLLLLLCLYVLFQTLPSPDVLLICAFAACWLGDILLIPEGNGWFVSGGVSFFIGHLLLIFGFAKSVDFENIPLAIIIPAGVLYAAISGYVMFRARKEAPGIMQIPMLLYLLCNSATNLLALSRMAESFGVLQAAAYAGAALFFISDCALFLMRYDKEKKGFYKSDFFVMLTYASGVLLVALGLAPILYFG